MHLPRLFKTLYVWAFSDAAPYDWNDLVVLLPRSPWHNGIHYFGRSFLVWFQPMCHMSINHVVFIFLHLVQSIYVCCVPPTHNLVFSVYGATSYTTRVIWCKSFTTSLDCEFLPKAKSHSTFTYSHCVCSSHTGCCGSCETLEGFRFYKGRWIQRSIKGCYNTHKR